MVRGWFFSAPNPVPCRVPSAKSTQLICFFSSPCVLVRIFQRNRTTKTWGGERRRERLTLRN